MAPCPDSMDNPFSTGYAEARAKFRAVANAAGAEVESFPLDHRGPNDIELTTDTAWVGQRSARAVLVTASGTHGVEGFFGSCDPPVRPRPRPSIAATGCGTAPTRPVASDPIQSQTKRLEIAMIFGV